MATKYEDVIESFVEMFNSGANPVRQYYMDDTHCYSFLSFIFLLLLLIDTTFYRNIRW